MLTKIRERAEDALLWPGLVMGVGGAVAGGLLMRSAGFGGYAGAIVTTIVAMIGAVLLTVLTAYVNGRRLYARQL
jgi:uncharacterized membrane protein YeaQ/YmgE (transglycosylase-associated protein family)